MDISRIDTDGWYKMALQGVGFNVDDYSTELILQAIKLAEAKGANASLSDLAEIKHSVQQLKKIEANVNS